MVRNRRRDGAALEAEAAREGNAAVSVPAVALDDRELQEVARDVGLRPAKGDARSLKRRAGRERTGAHLDDAQRGAHAGRNTEARAVEAVDVETRPRFHRGSRDLLEQPSALRDAAAAEDHEIGPEVVEPLERQEVGPVPGRDGPAVPEAVMAPAPQRGEGGGGAGGGAAAGGARA